MGEKMTEDKEEQKGFRVKDKRLFSKSDEERQKIIQQGTASADQKTGSQEQTINQQSAESLPEVDFSALIFSLSTQAIIQLGEVEDPITKKKEQNLPQAKQMIDILGVLKEKTKGNLTKEEQSMLDNLLFDLRMRYVKLSK
jgi:TRAP-type mannitol/chloroaromatic compound transport system substrate-binding protein